MVGDRLRDPSEREARATRILDATAELLLRHGYRRVTVDDIARHADIGKGTVYLHWKTRDELVTAVFEREGLQAIEELLEDLRQQPETCLLHRLARSYFLAIMNRPLLRGYFLADAELLGKLARPGRGARENRHHLMSHAYLDLLTQHGLLRTDLSTDALAYAFLATFEGFLQAQANTPDQANADPEPNADLLALTVQRAFETGHTVSPATQQTIATRVIDLLTELRNADRADLGISGG